MNLQVDKNELRQLCRQNAITYLAVFGSHARGEETGKSDIDLLVDYADAKSMFDHVRIQRKLTQLFGKEVDLVTRRSLSPYIRDYVNADLEVLYAEG